MAASYKEISIPMEIKTFSCNRMIVFAAFRHTYRTMPGHAIYIKYMCVPYTHPLLQKTVKIALIVYPCVLLCLCPCVCVHAAYTIEQSECAAVAVAVAAAATAAQRMKSKVNKTNDAG